MLSQLSYGPIGDAPTATACAAYRILLDAGHLCGRLDRQNAVRSLKEVIQPHLPIRLPCYDFTLGMNHTVVTVLPKVRLATSGATHSHGVTGGVYKARERIHRSNADLRLLAIPTSRSRVADSDPDWDQVSGIC